MNLVLYYFETYNRDNIDLVDLRSNPITHINEKGIQTEEEHFDLDIIVFATGYDAMTGPLLNMNRATPRVARGGSLICLPLLNTNGDQ